TRSDRDWSSDVCSSDLRKGASGGPRDLRLGSDSVETYSPALGRDLEDLPLADIGDCELPDGAPPREQLDAARAEIAAWWRPGLKIGRASCRERVEVWGV